MLSLPSMPSQFLSNAALCLRISPVRCICFISLILLTRRPTFTRTKVVLRHVFEGNIFLFPFAANEVHHRRRACHLDDCGNLADASWLVHCHDDGHDGHDGGGGRPHNHRLRTMKRIGCEIQTETKKKDANIRHKNKRAKIRA